MGAFGTASSEFSKTNSTTAGSFGSASQDFVNLKLREEEQKKGATILRNATPTLNMVRDISFSPSTTPVKGTSLTVGKQPLGNKIRSYLPESIASNIYDPLREGLFGYTGQGSTITGFKEDKGLLGFLEPALFKSKAEKLMERYDALRAVGTDEGTAWKLAGQDVDMSVGEKVAGAVTGKLIPTTKEQSTALADIRKWEDLDAAFGVLDAMSLGASKPVTTAVSKTLRGAETAIRGTEKSDEAVHQILNAITDEGGDAAKKSAAFQRFRSKMADKLVALRETTEDEWIRIKNLQRSEGTKVTEETDAYDAREAMPGRIEYRLNEARQQMLDVVKKTDEVAKANGIAPGELQKTIDDYLIARHAAERIAAVGNKGAPMTVDEAKVIMDTVEKSPMAAEVKGIADELQALHNKTLDILRDGQVITNDLYETLRARYKSHVPLQRIMENTDDVASGLTATNEVRSTGIKRAVGSDRAVGDITSNIVWNYQQAVIRAEKNRVGRAFAQFVRDNPHLEGFKVRGQKALGEAFAKNADGTRPLLMEQGNDPHTFHFFENGKHMFIEVADPHIAAALRGVGKEYLPSMFKFINAYTRFYSSLSTRWSLEFGVTNKIRDIQEAVIYAAANGEGFRALKQFSPTSGGRVAGDMRTIVEYIANNGKAGKELSKDAQLYRQMLQDGGSTGGYMTQSIGDLRISIEEMRALNRSRPKQAAKKVLSYIENFNRVFEESTRFTVYKNAMERGASRAEAARMAREATVNFNRMGTGGPIINSLYMFANASIQGSAKLLRAMRNPKVAGAVATAVGAAVVGTSEWNDAIDPEWRKVVTKWDRMNGLPVMLPGMKESGEATPYIVIPVSWGVKPIKVAFDTLYDVLSGENTDVGDATARIVQSLIEGYNPVGGTDLYSALIPTIVDIPSELVRNHAWYGGKISPDYDKYAPDSLRFFPDIKDTATGRTFVRITRGLSGMGIEISPETLDYAYNQYIGGAGRFASKTINTIASIGKGELPKAKDAPFISRFYRSKSIEEVGAGSDASETLNELLTEQSRERLLLQEAAEEAYATIIASPPEQRKDMFNNIAKTDPEKAKEIQQIKADADKGLTYTDRKVLKLGVENGERAKFLFDEINSLPTKELKREKFNEYVTKGIITGRVATQISYLVEHPQ